MFGLFGDKKKKKGKAAANPNTKSSEAVREAALAQFRKTEEELGPETIAAMKKAVQLEQAKKKIRSAIDDDSQRESVAHHLRDIIDEDKR